MSAAKQWRTVWAPFGAVVHPLLDLVDHDLGDDTGETCVCGPTWHPEKYEDGQVVFILVHHSLDGRENDERTTT